MTGTTTRDDGAAARANTIPWPPLLFALAIAGAIALGRYAPLAWPGIDDTAARMIGFGFGGIGLALFVWAIVTLRRGGTTVMPHGTTSVLIERGPYARFRNPIYLGEVLMLFGLAQATLNFWFVAAAILFAILVTGLQILPEERHLSARFGADYDSYKQRTRRWI